MAAFNLEEVLLRWKEVSKINSTKIIDELVKTPSLHSEFLEYYVFFRAKLSASEKKYNLMAWQKRKYYRGEMDQSDLTKNGWSQWNGLKPSSSELNGLLEMDNDMNDLKERVDGYKTAVQTTEYIIKQINSRDWSLKSIIEYNKYLSGG